MPTPIGLNLSVRLTQSDIDALLAKKKQRKIKAKTKTPAQTQTPAEKAKTPSFNPPIPDLPRFGPDHQIPPSQTNAVDHYKSLNDHLRIKLRSAEYRERFILSVLSNA
jgi:hypothetical protein